MTDLAALLDEALKDATDTKAVAFGRGAVHRTGEVFASTFPGKRAVVVGDDNTFNAVGATTAAGEPVAAGPAVVDSLKQAGVELEENIIFPGTPTLYGGYDNVEIIREKLRGLDAIAIVVGSGVLNDLTKLASGELGRPYMVVCTAASMDGYASFGASISKDGFKITRNCPAPAAVVADLDIMAAAPKRLVATGVGDLIEKIPAGEDWIIADMLGVEAINHQVWPLVQGPLREAISQPAQLRAGDADATAGLAAGLLMSGLAMQAAQSSRPASGAGHQFSHLWEMEGHGLDWEPPLTHGFKVGLGTVAICALYDVALRKDISDLDVEARIAAWPSREGMEAHVRQWNQSAPSGLLEAAVVQTDAKYLTPQQLRERIHTLQKLWPQIKETSAKQLLSAEEIADVLKTVGGIYHPAQIGISLEKMRETYTRAQMIRTRYTILDVLWELGILDECVEELFAPGGYWASAPVPTDRVSGAED